MFNFIHLSLQRINKRGKIYNVNKYVQNKLATPCSEHSVICSDSGSTNCRAQLKVIQRIQMEEEESCNLPPDQSHEDSSIFYRYSKYFLDLYFPFLFNLSSSSYNQFKIRKHPFLPFSVLFHTISPCPPCQIVWQPITDLLRNRFACLILRIRKKQESRLLSVDEQNARE